MHRLNQVLCYVEMWFIEKSTKQKNPEKVFDKIQVYVRVSIINLAVLFQNISTTSKGLAMFAFKFMAN